ncbi:MAG: hypothetical protein EXQ60_03835 [Candidatus Nanopelagicales bacterium]|nr:hypothetical protein [Candidatus Nanopelagicales bacterium]
MSGPLIPGMREFDAPRKKNPAFLWWLLGLLVLAGVIILGLGVFVAVGPLRQLGLVTEKLEPLAFRPTIIDTAVQIAVALPAGGLCTDDVVDISLAEDAVAVYVGASVTTPRNISCPAVGLSADQLWVDVQLLAPLAQRQVVRADDGQVLSRESSTGLG